MARSTASSAGRLRCSLLKKRVNFSTQSKPIRSLAVAIARSLTNTFAGIRPIDLPGFILAELAGAAVGMLLMKWLLGPSEVRGPVAIAQTQR